MAHFYGRIQGSRGEATRMGTKNSGIHGTVETWSYIITSDLWHDSEGQDRVEVRLTGKYGERVGTLFSGKLEDLAELLRTGVTLKPVEQDTSDQLLEAASAVMLDLDHYASTHGPGPDRRRDALWAAIDAAKR